MRLKAQEKVFCRLRYIREVSFQRMPQMNGLKDVIPMPQHQHAAVHVRMGICYDEFVSNNSQVP